ncbi:MAG: site-specific integrase [Candidatus ainarchaeum sp.]|nr:site-specific integrase [Candidatus ainarchaeum sp.]
MASIYHDDKRIANAVKNLNSDINIPPIAKDEITKYIEYCAARGIKKVRFPKLIGELSKMATLLKKSFKEANKDDLISLAAKIESLDLADYTKYEYKVVLKRFYKYLEGRDIKYPEKIDWLKPKEPMSTRLPEDILTEEELLKMIESAEHPRDRAIMMLLSETGFRVGELATLKIKNITFETEMGYVRVDGKTGPRRIPIVPSIPYLAAWLDLHPQKNNPEAPLWPCLANKDRNNPAPMGYNAIRKLLITIGKRAKITKRINPHSFRHARATLMARKNISEQQMKQYMGWSQNSKEVSTYVHMASKDLNDPIKKLYGLKIEETEKSKFAPKDCPRCSAKNSPNSNFCTKCACPLDTQTLLDYEQQKKENEDLLDKILTDPIIRKQIVFKLLNK